MIPTERYQGAVVPPLIATLVALGIAPIGFRRDGSPIMPIAGGDGSAVRDRLAARGRSIVAAAERQGRDLSDAEWSQVQGIVSQVDAEDRLQERRDRSGAALGSSGQQLSAITGPRVQVTRSEDTYRPDGEYSFFRDMIGAAQGDYGAAERLHRNNTAGEDRERRDGTSTSLTSMGSFIPPVWVVSEFAPLARAARTVADLVQHMGAPTSTSMVIPRVTTGVLVAGQVGDNASVAEQDIVTAQITRSTVTVAGQEDVSIQSLELGHQGVDRIIFADLQGAYDEELDRQVIRGSGTNELLGINQVSGINAVTYTDASPTVPEFYPKLADAIQQIGTGRKLPATATIMHPRRWGWVTASLDTQNRPLVVPSGDVNAIGRQTGAVAEGRSGEMQGPPVYSDSNLAITLGGGTEDQIIVIRASDILLYEAPVRARMLQETLSGTLTVRFQLWSYANLFAGRYPKSISTIGGTGLAAPTF